MKARALPWIAAALVAATPAAAAGRDAALLVVGWSGTSAEVAKHQAKWDSEKTLVADVLAIAPGFPKVLGHEDVPELAAGSSALVLGACSPRDAAQITEILQAHQILVSPLTTHRAPEDAACPERVQGARRRQAMVVDPGALSAVVLERKDASGQVQQLLHLIVRSRVPGASDFDAVTDHQEQTLPPGCTLQLSHDGPAARIAKTCPGASSGDEVLRYAVSNGKLVKAAGLEAMASVQAVIGGGGATEAEARESLARWQGAIQHAGALFSLPAGYPKIVKSDDYPGLKPGVQIVLLGLCPADRLAEPMKVLPLVQPGTYAKAVKVTGDPACPYATGVAMVEQSRANGKRLTVVGYAGSPNPDRVLVFLQDGKGTMLDSNEYDAGMKACVVSHVGADGGMAFATFSCRHPGEAGDRTSDLELTYEVHGSKLTRREKESEPQ